MNHHSHEEHGGHEHEGHHHEMPTEGRALTNVAVSATLHCLTGCAIGEVTGMAIGTALGFSDLGTIALAVGLAFLFGYSLTSLPLLRAGFALSAVIPIALASDTFSIAVMEIVDNLIMVAIPGAMDAGLGDVLFWGALSFALFVAFLAALPVNRWLIGRGKGHVAVHETGIHGGPDPRLVGVVLGVAAVFGAAVLIAELASDEDVEHGGHETVASAADGEHNSEHEEGTMPASDAEGVRGLTASEGGLTLELDQAGLPAGSERELGFHIAEGGEPVTEFDIEHERRMHLIVVRKDLTGFQHLHPRMDDAGTWTTPITLDEAGDYRVYADFNHDGESLTLASDLSVAGEADYEELPLQQTETETATGYEVGVEGEAGQAGKASELTFNVVRDGRPVEVEPYLGADGHLVALREGDLAFLHVHPVGAGHEEEGTSHEEEGSSHGAHEEGGEGIRFETEFPSEGSYRLFLQFKHNGEVHTAEFTREVAE
ncbi:MAG: DUF4396 domain-containing protein [Actinomycetota bacterium]|nr:DUF4396 domain-containing protein [Actinomycetota bacterium]